ncbi:MAG: PAS domain S-box protein, partial [Mariprofundus sp.]
MKQTSDELAEKEAFERFVQASPAVLYRLRFQPDARTPPFMQQAGWPADMGGSFTLDYISEQVRDFLGDSPESLLGYPNWWAERIHPDDCKRTLKGYAKLFAEGEVVHEYRLQRSDGDYVWLEVSARMYRDASGLPVEIVGAWIDVSERKEFERERDILVTYPQLNPEPVMRADASGHILHANPAALALFPDTLENEGIRRIPGLEQLDAADCIAHNVELSVTGQVGDRHYQWLVRGLADLGFLHIYGADITERVLAEQRVAASEARYRRLVELSSVCIHEIDLQGKLLSMNAAGLRMNCVSAEANVLGRPYLNGVASDERAAIALLLEQAMQGKPSEFEFHGAGAMSGK